MVLHYTIEASCARAYCIIHARAPRRAIKPSHHILSALIDVLIDMDTIRPAVPSLLPLIPVLESHTGDVVLDGTKALHCVRKPFVRFA